MKKTLSIVILLCLTAISCTDSGNTKNHLAEIEKLQLSLDSLKNATIQHEAPVKNQIATFLTFQDNRAEEAMNLYVELFDNSEIIDVQRWGKEAPGEEGRIMHATFNLNGKPFMCSDSPPVHDWNFSPAVSNYVECGSEGELERLFSKLAEEGNVFMPLNNYGFSQRFGWVVDQFGVSWQLNLK